MANRIQMQLDLLVHHPRCHHFEHRFEKAPIHVLLNRAHHFSMLLFGHRFYSSVLVDSQSPGWGQTMVREQSTVFQISFYALARELDDAAGGVSSVIPPVAT
jgi:hypothetical protein